MISFKHLLFGDIEVPFVAQSLRSDQIEERVELQTPTSSIDITHKHCIVSMKPLIVAVWSSPEDAAQVANSIKLVVSSRCVVANVRVHLNRRMSISNGELALFQCSKSRLRQLSFFRRSLLLIYLRSCTRKHNISEIQNLCSLYSYPRNVVLASVKGNGFSTVFPIDFKGFIKEAGCFLMGLRKTNSSLKQILEFKKFVICRVPGEAKGHIYELGKNHLTLSSKESDFPFICFPSVHFLFPVPAFAFAYFEIELLQNVDMGSHQLLIGRIVNQVQICQDKSELFHIHAIYALHRRLKAVHVEHE